MPTVVGHRGAAAHAPENTIEGIRVAAAQGVTAVEVDVKLTKDGHPVLMHDERVDRTTNGTGAVTEHTLAELKQLDAGGWFGPKFAGARVPDLGEVLGVCAELDLAVNVEIKPAPGTEAQTIQSAIKAIHQRWPENGLYLILSSFSNNVLTAAARQAPSIPRAAIFRQGQLETWLAKATASACVAIHVRQDRLTARRVAGIKDAGFFCGAFTVNNVEVAQRFLTMGVDYVFSDRPAEIAAHLVDG